MALSQITPRDRLQRLADLGRKTLRYWWLIAVFAVVGGGLSLAFAMLKARNYQSWATLFYQERIQSQLLSPNREEINQRNIGDKYRELLLARSQLAQIVNDPKLNPFPADEEDVAIDKLRDVVKFEARGNNAFRIVYADSDRNRAKGVTEKLTELLQKKEEALRNEQARMTVEFATAQKEEAAKELRLREQALAQFLAGHPEFAGDANQPSEGASIRATAKAKATQMTSGNSQVSSLERQRQRIQSRLDAPPDSPPIRIAAPPSAERVAAQAVVNEAERELSAANRDLEDQQSKGFTDKHPAMIKAAERVKAAQQRLRHAQGAVPPETETIIAPATPQDREKLQKQLRELDQRIAEQRGGKKPGAASESTNWVVKLETDHTDLRRAVAEQRERVESLADSVFRAQMDASQKAAEAGGRLEIVDPAFRPVKPTGPGKTIFLLAGMVLFVSLGVGIAILLAVIDDRLYRRVDLDHLGIAVLGVIPRPIHRARRRKPPPRIKDDE
jgi:uncharacterized protein involved in exopolysaccharide biosynthesis